MLFFKQLGKSKGKGKGKSTQPADGWFLEWSSVRYLLKDLKMSGVGEPMTGQ